MALNSHRSRWHVAGRVLVAALLGYVLANTLGLFLAFALPVDRLSGVIIGTLATFVIWASVVIWVFASGRLRTVVASLLAAIVLTGGAAWGLYLLEASS